MRDAAGLVPPLSWLAVWNRQLIAGRKEAGQEHEYEYGQDEREGNSEDDEDELDRSGVLYSKIHNTDSSPSSANEERDLLARRIGLAQGLVDFTRSFARRQPMRNDDEQYTPDKIDPCKEIKVVQSQNQRLVFLQPEPEYWFVATFDRYLPQSSSSQSTDNTAKASQKKSQSQQPRLHPASFLPNEALADLLKRAYAEFRLFNGTFSVILAKEGQVNLRTKVTAFFNAWRDEARLIPLGIPQGPPNSAHQFLQPPSGYSIVAVSHSGVLNTSASTSTSPTNDFLTPADKLALSCHLATLLPKPKLLNTPSLSATTKSSKGKEKQVRKQASLSSSTWKSLHLGGISSYLQSMPGMPGTLSSSVTPQSQSTARNTTEANLIPTAGSLSSQESESGQPTRKAETAKRTASGSGWIPTFGLFGSASSYNSKDKVLAHAKKCHDSSGTIIPETPTGEALDRRESLKSPNNGKEPESVLGDPPDSAASEASMEALSEAILDNISPDIEIEDAPDLASIPSNQRKLQDAEGKEGKSETSMQSKFRAVWHESRTVYVGKDLSALPCQCLSNDDIAIALIRPTTGMDDTSTDDSTIQDQSLDKGAIDQYFTHLATLQAFPPPSATSQNPTSRTFLSFGYADCSDVVEQIIDDRASATTASLGQRYNLAINAKTDTDKLLRPDTRELFVRTHFSQWLIAERKDSADGPSKLTILPKSVGKEGSLVDADAEIQRLAEEER